MTVLKTLTRAVRQGCGLLEISRGKQLVWNYSQPKGDQSMMAVEMLSLEGKPLPGIALR